MRRHIILTFGCMFEQRVAVRHQPRKKSFEIASHFRVGIFLDQERSGCVLDQQSDAPVYHATLGDELLNLIGEFIERPSARLQLDLMQRLLNHGSPAWAEPICWPKLWALPAVAFRIQGPLDSQATSLCDSAIAPVPSTAASAVNR